MSKLKKRRLTLIIIMSLLVLCAVGVVIFKLYEMMSEPLFDSGITKNSAITNITTADDKSFNALLIGTDAEGYNTDALMIVHVDKENKKIRMLSIPRDTRVKVNGRNHKINACYYIGGLDLLFEKIKELTEIEINYYAMIQPGTLAEIVDCLGGVEYDVEQNMRYSDPVQDLYIDLDKGLQVLNGDQAEQYCRYRSYVMGDITRTQSQQKFFKALFEQKLNIKYATKINDIYKILSEKVDTNVSLKDILYNTSVFQLITGGDQIECYETPGTYNDMEKDGISYFIIEGDYLTELKELCAEYFGGSYVPEEID